ncbi:MAG TPA: hypothetical protein VLC91_13845, partial [Spongiibacteraceae bacterium]|nr:hypothetical protein [Spongiibacteraceae bacterium]
PASLATAADVNVLYPGPSTNDDLALGIYQIGGSYPSGTNFLDQFKFSLANAQNVAFSIADSQSTDTASTPSPSGSMNLFDNSFLTFSVFDNTGKYLGSGAENNPLSLSNLAAGQPYTLTISGIASGIFGGQYKGTVDVGATASPVPIGATLPMFSAALLSLCIRRRQIAKA